jgi:hypothetical protein
MQNYASMHALAWRVTGLPGEYEMQVTLGYRCACAEWEVGDRITEQQPMTTASYSCEAERCVTKNAIHQEGFPSLRIEKAFRMSRESLHSRTLQDAASRTWETRFAEWEYHLQPPAIGLRL